MGSTESKPDLCIVPPQFGGQTDTDNVPNHLKPFAGQFGYKERQAVLKQFIEHGESIKIHVKI